MKESFIVLQEPADFIGALNYIFGNDAVERNVKHQDAFILGEHLEKLGRSWTFDEVPMQQQVLVSRKILLGILPQ